MRPSREDVQGHVEEWSKKLEKRGQGWWPRFAYHFTDVQNAISILNGGVLYSRAEAERRGVMKNDNADPTIIAQTGDDHLDLVRLYFRSLTPTLWRNEGIRKRVRQGRGHCPVPVFLLFDVVTLIARDGVRFSRGTLASYKQGHSDKRDYFLHRMPWEDIYSDGPMHPASRRDDIKKARHAEVIIPEQVPVDPLLKGVVCRTPAERATLLHGLSAEVQGAWERRTRLDPGSMFNRKYAFVHNVAGRDGQIIEFELSKPMAHPLDADFRFDGDGATKAQRTRHTISRGVRKQHYRLPRAYVRGLATLYLEGCLAHRAPVVLDDLPF